MVNEPWYKENSMSIIGLSLVALLAILAILLIYLRNKNKKIRK